MRRLLALKGKQEVIGLRHVVCGGGNGLRHAHGHHMTSNVLAVTSNLRRHAVGGDGRKATEHQKTDASMTHKSALVRPTPGGRPRRRVDVRPDSSPLPRTGGGTHKTHNHTHGTEHRENAEASAPRDRTRVCGLGTIAPALLPVFRAFVPVCEGVCVVFGAVEARHTKRATAEGGYVEMCVIGSK